MAVVLVVARCVCVHMVTVAMVYVFCVAVDSNDSLYAGDRKFVSEVAKLVHTVLQQVLDHIKSLATSDEVGREGGGGGASWVCVHASYILVCVTTITMPVNLHGTNFAPFLLLTRRCYGAETSAILLLLKRAFA